MTPPEKTRHELCPLAETRSMFLGLELSQEARLALRLLPTLEGELIAHILDAALVFVVSGNLPQAQLVAVLQHEQSIDGASLGALFTGVHWVLRACMRSSLTSKALLAELADLKVQSPFVALITQATERGRAELQPAAAAALATTAAVQWRLDVTMSSSSLHRVLRPNLTMVCVLSDQSASTFALSKRRFNELRFTCAKLLKDMQDYEARRIWPS